MTNWKDYCEHMKNVDPEAYEDLEEAKTLAQIVTAIIARREELGLSQRDLAALCKLPQSSIARMEGATVKPNIFTLLRIMKPLGLTLTVVRE